MSAHPSTLSSCGAEAGTRKDFPRFSQGQGRRLVFEESGRESQRDKEKREEGRTQKRGLETTLALRLPWTMITQKEDGPPEPKWHLNPGDAAPVTGGCSGG